MEINNNDNEKENIGNGKNIIFLNYIFRFILFSSIIYFYMKFFRRKRNNKLRRKENQKRREELEKQKEELTENIDNNNPDNNKEVSNPENKNAENNKDLPLTTVVFDGYESFLLPNHLI
jgi:flagellar biosynthesis/type III secretory pathway M-ring protein FliF/YscJ